MKFQGGTRKLLKVAGGGFAYELSRGSNGQIAEFVEETKLAWPLAKHILSKKQEHGVDPSRLA